MTETVAPALGISVQVTAGSAQLVFQTHVPQETTAEALSELVDRVQAVAKRQQAIADLVELRRSLKGDEQTLVRMREDRARIDALQAAPQEGRRNPNRAADADLAKQRSQADATEKRMVEIINNTRQQIADTEAIAGA